jgi:anti-sigma B factor antagonist
LEAFDFSVRETRSGVWKLVGELDVTGVPDVKDHLAASEGDILLDCADLTFIDAAGLGMFVELHTSCEARGLKLVIGEPPVFATRLLELTGLDGLLNIQISGTGV